MHIEEKLKTLPDKSGVYIMKNSSGEIIYVGKAKVLKNRVRQYFKGHNHSIKVSKMIENIADFEYIITDSEQEALILENNLIKENMPKYNILLKDDKTYPFIKITLHEDFPSVFMTRRIIRDGSKYFGPYCNSANLKEILELIDDVFGLKKCKKAIVSGEPDGKSCLYYQMKQCSAPCICNIDKDSYRKIVDDVISFLNGKYDGIYSVLSDKMKQAASKLDFETAASLRDKIKSLDIIGEKQKIVSSGGADYDVIAAYNSNDNACIEIFFVRGGKIVGKEHYFLSNTEGSSNGILICEFIKQYYDRSTFIPSQIIVQEDFEENEELCDWLSKKINKSVKITIPKIGDKLKLINMIAANAKKEHRERELKLMRDISFKNHALAGLRDITGMSVTPTVIEAYDISNISGSHMVGAMVTFENGKPCREKYRNFKIKYSAGQDDYACMREVLERRIENGIKERDSNVENPKFYPFPHIFLVDGGEAHLEVAISVLKKYKLNIPAFGIVKDNRHCTDGLVGENGRLNIAKNSEEFMLLTQIQDEMHRRAISYHRQLRSKSLLESELSQINGVGEKRSKLLLKQFRSVKRIKNATLEELEAIPGIDAKTAQNVYSYFNGL